MAILDLTHPLTPTMPVYPGAPQPELRQVATVAGNGWDEKWIGLSSHHGTHIDAPAHMVVGAPTLDQLGADRFVGPGWVVDVAHRAGGRIQVADLEPHREAIARADFVLFRTGWDARWGRDDYFRDFPVLDPEAAAWLAATAVKGVGFDVASADPVGAACAIHLILFGAGKILIENLAGLEQLVGRSFVFSCLPLAVEGADGSPVRAVAMVD
jgi:kynurenine formamidase